MPMTRSSSNAAAPTAADLIPGLTQPDLSPLSSDPDVEHSLFNDNMGARQSEVMIDPMVPGLTTGTEHRRATRAHSSTTPVNTSTIDDNGRADFQTNLSNENAPERDVDPPRNSTLENILDRLTTIIAAQANRSYSDDIIVNALRNTRSSQSPFDSSGKEPKVNNPDVFQGERNKLTNFLMQVNLVFKLQPRRYTTHESKIYYVIGYLRGAPETSIKSYLSLPDTKIPDFLKDYSKFETYLKNTWGDPDERRTAAIKINEVRQVGSSAAYFAQIEQYAAILAWQDEVLIHIARNGLKAEIKDLLVGQTEIPDDWPGFVRKVNEIDIRLHERQVERSKEGRSTSRSDNPRSSDNRTTQDRRPNRPINNADRPQARNDYRPTFVQNRTNPNLGGPISPEERDRRIRDGLCLRCGRQGHLARECQAGPPTPNTRPTMSAPSQFTTSPTSTTISARQSSSSTTSEQPSRLNAIDDRRKSSNSERSSTKVSAPPQ